MLSLIYQNAKHMTQTQIKAEFQKRMNLVNDQEFVKMCAAHAEKLGITPEQWNENKAMILLWFANKALTN